MSYNESKYRYEWERNNRDRIVLLVPKGNKAQIKAKALELGYKSLNEYINMLIEQALK